MEARTTAQKGVLVLGCLQALLVASLVVAQDFEGVEPLHLESYFKKGWKLPGTILTAFVTAASALLIVCNDPRRKPTRAILRCVSEAAFGDQKDLDGSVLAHKVTFFLLRPRRGRLLGRAWRRVWRDKAQLKLVPRYRYPAGAKKPRRSFRIDKNDPTLCEGVAGLVFLASRGSFISMSNLPRLNSSSETSEFEEYARLTNDCAGRVRKHEHFDMRSIGGFQVLSPDGDEILGVLMFDSADSEGVEVIRGKTTIQRYLKTLSRVEAS